MKVQQIEYRRRVAVASGFATFGAVADVGEDETREEALAQLQQWVVAQLADHELDNKVGLEVRDKLEAKRIELMNVERRLLEAERRWRLAEKFLIRHGIEVPDNDSPFDRPPPYVQ
jgi:hypothetical protein